MNLTVNKTSWRRSVQQEHWGYVVLATTRDIPLFPRLKSSAMAVIFMGKFNTANEIITRPRCYHALGDALYFYTFFNR